MYKKNNIVLSTTPTIDGCQIQDYKGIISANVVMGVNILKEFVASFSDFFGGTSGKYSGEMDKAYNKAINILERKANALGANSIVGVHVDYDEISGGGKSMLMVSIVGTAVTIVHTSEISKEVFSESMDVDTLNRLFHIEHYRSLLADRDWMPNNQDWNIILNGQLVELLPQLLPIYITSKRRSITVSDEGDLIRLCRNNFIILLNNAEDEDALNVVYGDWSEDPAIHKIMVDLIIQCHLFDANAILQKLPILDKHSAILLLTAEKKLYYKSDIKPLKELSQYFNNLPDTGHYEKSKTGMFSKEEDVLVCEKGHKTPLSKGDFCCYNSVPACGLNIKGITKSELSIINEFTMKVNVLEKFFLKNINTSTNN